MSTDQENLNTPLSSQIGEWILSYHPDVLYYSLTHSPHIEDSYLVVLTLHLKTKNKEFRDFTIEEAMFKAREYLLKEYND